MLEAPDKYLMKKQFEALSISYKMKISCKSHLFASGRARSQNSSLQFHSHVFPLIRALFEVKIHAEHHKDSNPIKDNNVAWEIVYKDTIPERKQAFIKGFWIYL